MDTIKEIWQTLCTNKLRTVLTGISVAWGIFMLILLLSIAKGLLNGTIERTMESDPNRISVWGGSTSLPYMGMKEGRRIPLRVRSLEAIEESSPTYIASADGSIAVNARISTSKDYLAGACTGVYPTYFTGRYKIMNGRPINAADLNDMRKVIVLHESSAEILFDNPQNAVGSIVNVGNLAFKVIGVYSHQWERESLIPFTTARAISGYNDNLNQINVHLQNVTDQETSGALEIDIRRAMAKTEHFDPNDNSAIWTFDRFASSIQELKGIGYLNIAMWVIGVLTLITGIVGVSNIMFVSVRERTHEIGIRRAIGAKPRNILTQVVLESIVLTTAFGYIGIVMGTVATEAVKYAFRDSDMFLNPSVDIAIAIEVTLALIIAGALAGLFPALRAIKVKPVEALRDE